MNLIIPGEGMDYFKFLNADPFKNYSSAEIQDMINNKRSELRAELSKAQVAERKRQMQQIIDDELPKMSGALVDPDYVEKSRMNVLKVLTAKVQKYVFHRIDGTEVVFKRDVSNIIDDVGKTGWTIGPDVLSKLDKIIVVDSSEFKDDVSNSMTAVKAIDMDDLVGWTNKAIDSLYKEGAPQYVTPQTSFKALQNTINTLAARAQKIQKNPNYKDAE